MNGVTVNSPRVQLQRCTELEYLLLGDLREMLEAQTTPQSRRWMLAVLDTLLDMLPREHRLKSLDGYLSEVLSEFPNWSIHVDRLEAEHYDLYDRLSDLRDELEDEDPPGQAANSVRYSLQKWMEAFAQHRRMESELLVSAVNIDIGGSG